MSAFNLHDLARAFCSDEDSDDRLSGEACALNAEGRAPEWVQLWPTGRLAVGRDGRRFSVSNPAAIVEMTKPRLPLVIDYEHDTERRVAGQETPAAGWITDLEVRDGTIWGRAEWVERAANAIAAKEWRFVSPVYVYRRDTEPMEVVRFGSVGLTHNPNIHLKALNRAQPSTQESSMKDLLIRQLNLKADASDADVVAAVNALKGDHDRALNAQNDLTRYVPKAQHDETVAALNSARATIAERDAADRKRDAETLVDDAVAKGKIAPAARDAYLALALNSFDATRTAIGAMPVVLTPGADTTIKTDPATAAGALTAEEKALCSRLGIDEAAYAKAAA